MSRRKSLVEDILEIGAALSWPVGVVLAAVVFVGLKTVADRLAVPIGGHGAGIAGSIAVHGLYGMLTRLMQWLIPPLLLIGAGVSWWKRRHRVGLLRGAAGDGRYIERMSWRDFERLVGEAFRRQGYSISEAGGGGADGGVDLILRKDGREVLVQCKQWKKRTVGVTTVRELRGVMAHRGAAGGILVTAGRFTREAEDFARTCGIRLISGAALEVLIRDAATSSDAGPRDLPSQDTPRSGTIPSCPRCGAHMVLRTARQGASVGQQFYGCSRYPKCKGTVPAVS